jgi:hypothetical protein
MNANTLPNGSFFNAKHVANYLRDTFGENISCKFYCAKFPNVEWVDGIAFVRTSDVMAWFLNNFDNQNIHPDTKFWSAPRTVAHQFFIEMECEVHQFMNTRGIAPVTTLA